MERIASNLLLLSVPCNTGFEPGVAKRKEPWEPSEPSKNYCGRDQDMLGYWEDGWKVPAAD